MSTGFSCPYEMTTDIGIVEVLRCYDCGAMVMVDDIARHENWHAAAADEGNATA